MPTTTLYLVRHGEATEGDEHSDRALTERGRRQATAVGAALSDVNPDALLHSSRRRATELRSSSQP
jgi:broad specificity phosphatase PhoE